jgi:hypothetical protein
MGGVASGSDVVTYEGDNAKQQRMGRIETIKKSLEALSMEEQHELMLWFTERRERLFDERLERDADEGKLDAMILEAIREDDAGRTRPL